MTTMHSSFFALLLSILLAISTSGIEMAAANRHHHHRHHHHGHHHHHHGHHHRKIHGSVELQPSAPPLPFPVIVPDVYNVSWNFNIKGWPYNQTFQAGDILVFKYDKDLHNVVPVNESNYLNCSIPEIASVYSSGEDSIVLRPGFNYFICGTMGHCIAGMLINVTAT